ncbi:NAD-dependent succinate-semialdehyde dehydrogenase [Paraburkholderia graminis]|uniref:NAD-dependent succinate-semialdehyde dehydrogenase n=1 Tax=Paraburkholderia graminis TaxID=60548 RepID=UPI0038BA6513
MYPTLSLYIDGEFLGDDGRKLRPVLNPANGSVLGQLPLADQRDLDNALGSAQLAFESWRWTSPLERSAILRRVGVLVREQAESIAIGLTLDQGKLLSEARAEVVSCADHAEWHAEECRRIYGRTIPSRLQNVQQTVEREPVGVCAAFTPWNFPISQAIRKVCAAIGAGCTIILKGPEETPSSLVALARIFHEAGLPPGCLNLVWGEPAEVSHYLIESPIVRKVSFTGSVPVGKQIAALAGRHMKRVTMELGGHSPVLVFEDSDIDRAAALLAAYKSRNAGQLCVAPSRFYVQERVHDRFVQKFTEHYSSHTLEDGLSEQATMGPLANGRRVDAMEQLTGEALAKGATVLCGGQKLKRPGNFFPPTVIVDAPDHCRVMNEEPFGPIAPVTRFSTIDEVVTRANSVPFGLAAYIFTESLSNARYATSRLEAGMINVNHFGIALAETPFGGVKDSGIGLEGGMETFDGYLVTKFVTEMSPPY